MMTRNCRYCASEASPRNLLRICTLPGCDYVVSVCEPCHDLHYPEEVEEKQAVLMAEIMLAEAAGDDAQVAALLPEDFALQVMLGMV